MWEQDVPDEDWVVRFLKAVVSDSEAFPPAFLAAALPLVTVFRQGRPMWDGNLPLAELAESAGFDAICDDIAERIGGSRQVVDGAGHEIRFTGQPLNEALLALWSGPSPGSTRARSS